MKKVLVIGVNSLIGSSIIKTLNKNYRLLGTSRRVSNNHYYLDLSKNNESWPEIGLCDVIIFCGSISSLEGCAQNETISYKVNVSSIHDVIIKYKQKNTQLIFFSSSHVFDGRKKFYTEDDSPNPLNILGKHKLKGEEIILNENGLVIRLTKVLDYKFKRFSIWCDSFQSNKPFETFTNLTVSLVPLKKVISFISKAIDNEIKGIIHISGPDEYSYYDIAKMIAKNLNFNENLIIKSIGHNDITGRKYFNTCLRTSEIVSEFGINILNTVDTLQNWCDNYKKRINKK